MTTEEGNLVTRLAEEYKILQEKIDKIGAFRFTIKGWSITVIIGALFAGSATSALSPTIWLFSLILLIVAFAYFEIQQARLSRDFGQRAITIENVISRILRRDARNAGSNDFVLLRFVPGIAHHLGHQHPGPGRPHSIGRSLSDAHIAFYLVQILLVSFVVLSHKAQSKDIVIKGAQMTIVPFADQKSSSALSNSTREKTALPGTPQSGSSSTPNKATPLKKTLLESKTPIAPEKKNEPSHKKEE